MAGCTRTRPPALLLLRAQALATESALITAPVQAEIYTATVQNSDAVSSWGAASTSTSCLGSITAAPNSNDDHAVGADTDRDAADALPPAGRQLRPAEVAHHARAYTATELCTFHCERVRKIPLSTSVC
ncbi:hypothetical protein DFH07DRAFT_1058163 [Mycena maculata]|uniref:Secreted protein n=1 Tax=Mycena maculata TaxID=230809 RepID=A0AAD7JSS6_9AGAR|nr:hypothetical protein DFH07DRAFT_1058163 [Mycena maculata]